MAVYLLVNVCVFVLFGWRWAIILRVLGYPISYAALVRYRLAAFGLSYFTPGPQFGGEPLQVYYLHKKHSVPMSVSLASITLDRLFELFVNFSFLVFGLSLTLVSGVLGRWQLPQALPLALILFFSPLGYLIFLAAGHTPLTALATRFWPVERDPRYLMGLTKTEGQMRTFCREQPKALITVVLVSAVVWVALILEYSLSLRFLGLSLNFVQLISVMTVARVVLLITPLPGALGVMEVGLALALGALGYLPAYGAGLALLVRGRDVLFGLAGLALSQRSSD